ncbi:MAG: hypothetical protein P8103_04500 [Candidatus Thiodiazotropha sp.]
MQEELFDCAEGPLEKIEFSNGHRDAAKRFSEHSRVLQSGLLHGCGIIELFKSLGVKMMPELKNPSVEKLFQGEYTQDAYAQQMIDEHRDAGVKPSRLSPSRSTWKTFSTGSPTNPDSATWRSCWTLSTIPHTRRHQSTPSPPSPRKWSTTKQTVWIFDALYTRHPSVAAGFLTSDATGHDTLSPWHRRDSGRLESGSV